MKPASLVRALRLRLMTGRGMTDVPPRASGGLFILGSARSGTTVLQNALNHSPDIFLLGEPDLHRDGGEPGFAARYNDQHRKWANQETKSSFLCPVLDTDGAWPMHLTWLTKRYRWVGSKIVVNANRDPEELERLFTFQARYFYDARYIFTFRDPVSAIGSTRGLQLLSGGPVEDVRSVMVAYASVVALYIRMLRNFPHVRAIFHEDVGPKTFVSIERWLGVSLAGSAEYYEHGRVRRYAVDHFEEEDREHLGTLSTLYTDLRNSAPHEAGRPQLEQNDGNPNPAHYTALGAIDRRARVIAGALGRGPVGSSL